MVYPNICIQICVSKLNNYLEDDNSGLVLWCLRYDRFGTESDEELPFWYGL